MLGADEGSNSPEGVSSHLDTMRGEITGEWS